MPTNLTPTTARPLVSITIPTYNRAHMVGEAIDAVLAQTYQNWELIIVNDGSKDNTAAVLDEYQKRDPRIRAINKENEGIPRTVNRGFSEARGQYVSWTSDDNLYHRTAIQAMVECLENDPAAMLVYTDSRIIDFEGNVLEAHRQRPVEDMAFACVITGCLLFRREILEKMDAFRLQWPRAHDYDFYRRIWKQFKVVQIPEVHYDYRDHPNSMSGNYRAINIEHAQVIESQAENREEISIAWGNCWFTLGKRGIQQDCFASAVWYLLKLARWRPSLALELWSRLWRACYNKLPMPVQRCWRAAKGGFKRS